MIFTTGNILLIGAVLLMAGILIQKPGYRFGIPALLLFLVVGMIFGCDGLGVQFDDVRGAQFVGMVSLSIILFAGGLGTRIKDIKPILAPGIVLSTVGVLLTTAITGIFVWWISGLSWTSIHFALLPSMLLAATMSSTDSASVFGILGAQKMNLKHNLRPTLELESGSNDPMAYLITTMLVDVLVTGDSVTVVSLLRIFLVQFVLGALLGFAFGRLGVWMLNRLNLDNRALYPIMAVAICFLTFSLTDTLGGNGYLAIYVTGIVIGNEKVSFRRETITFIDGLSWLCQIVMFLMLGLLVNPLEMWQVAGMALLIGLFMIVVARPISVFLSLIPFKNIPFKGKAFISWVGLRGAVPILFATYPVVAGLEDHYTIFNIVFFITILSLLVQGTTITSMAQYLKLSEPLLNDVSDFGVEIPEDSGSSLKDLYVTATMLEKGCFVRDLHLPQGQLVMMVKRDNELLVPNGQLELLEGDHLLIIQETKQ
mgnify:FL=1